MQVSETLVYIKISRTRVRKKFKMILTGKFFPSEGPPRIGPFSAQQLKVRTIFRFHTHFPPSTRLSGISWSFQRQLVRNFLAVVSPLQKDDICTILNAYHGLFSSSWWPRNFLAAADCRSCAER